MACSRLVDGFLPSIHTVARNYRSLSAVDEHELVQEGVVGLLRAARRYDPERATPFWAYASWWIRQAMQQLVSEVTGPVVLSDRAQRRLAAVKDARHTHAQAHGHEPSVGDLTVATGFTRTQVEELLCVERRPRALEERERPDDGRSVSEGLADPAGEDAYERVVDQLLIDDLPDLWPHLGDRQRRIIFARFGFGRPAQTLREIGDELGLSAERVRQLEDRALDDVRDALGLGADGRAHWPA